MYVICACKTTNFGTENSVYDVYVGHNQETKFKVFCPLCVRIIIFLVNTQNLSRKKCRFCCLHRESNQRHTVLTLITSQWLINYKKHIKHQYFSTILVYHCLPAFRIFEKPLIIIFLLQISSFSDCVFLTP